ncbi:hypothetical protein IWQ62_004135 [Dispira parvispora]|uniref:Glutamyl-tRNA(Gln) amidotransferase subunit C, mitochondrial n=1 Tax=Dispira parvispora TaxID=1520584 RepID=A0A9W8AT06_9FUNG|nr:hypothetical protein IWQ62_004135 [Dispira parvispora]
MYPHLYSSVRHAVASSRPFLVRHHSSFFKATWSVSELLTSPHSSSPALDQTKIHHLHRLANLDCGANSDQDALFTSINELERFVGHITTLDVTNVDPLVSLVPPRTFTSMDPVPEPPHSADTLSEPTAFAPVSPLLQHSHNTYDDYYIVREPLSHPATTPSADKN